MLDKKTFVPYLEPYHHYVDFDNKIVFKDVGFGLEYINYVEEVMRIAKSYNPENLLDFGCGDGKFLCEYQKLNTGCNLVGIDLNKNAIKFASNMLHNITFLCEDVFLLDDKNKFDVIVAIEVFEHIEMDLSKDIVSKLKTLLSEKGILIVCVPSVHKALETQHFRHYNEKILQYQFDQLNTVEIRFAHKAGYIEKVLRNLIQNRFFLVRENHYYRFIYKLYKSYTSGATKSNGAHIIGVFKK